MTIEDGFAGNLPPEFRWATSHSEYVWAADYSLRRSREIRERLLAEYAPLDEEYINRHRELQTAIASVQLFACISIESAANLYLAVRLGQRQFSAIERRPLRQKLLKLIEIREATESPASRRALDALERLVLTRNELVHPKSFVLALDQQIEYEAHPTMLTAEAACGDMRVVLDFLAAIDPDVSMLLL